MKLLFDQNLSFRLVREFSDIFPGSGQVTRLGLANADDVNVWQFARANGFALVSQDADFAEMALLRGPPLKVIWLRCGNRPTSFVVDLMRRHQQSIDRFGRDPKQAAWRYIHSARSISARVRSHMSSTIYVPARDRLIRLIFCRRAKSRL